MQQQDPAYIAQQQQATAAWQQQLQQQSGDAVQPLSGTQVCPPQPGTQEAADAALALALAQVSAGQGGAVPPVPE